MFKIQMFKTTALSLPSRYLSIILSSNVIESFKKDFVSNFDHLNLNICFEFRISDLLFCPLNFEPCFEFWISNFVLYFLVIGIYLLFEIWSLGIWSLPVSNLIFSRLPTSDLGSPTSVLRPPSFGVLPCLLFFKLFFSLKRYNFLELIWFFVWSFLYSGSSLTQRHANGL